jgi:hypothetical protein
MDPLKDKQITFQKESEQEGTSESGQWIRPEIKILSMAESQGGIAIVNEGSTTGGIEGAS